MGRVCHLFYFSVETHGRLAGEVVVKDVPHALAKLSPVLDDGRCYYLHRLWVAARHRRNGLAHKLMTRVVAWADDTGTSLCLRVRPLGTSGPQAAQLAEFYSRYGFKRWARIARPDVVMVRLIIFPEGGLDALRRARSGGRPL